MSPDTEPTAASNEAVSTPRPELPPLKREAMVVIRDGARTPLVIAACTLAGVSIGFLVAAMTLHAAPCRHVFAAPDTPASTAEVTYLGVEISTYVDQPHQRRGALVRGILPASPAAAYGIRRGELIVKVDEVPISSSRDLVRAVRSRPAGDEVTVVLMSSDGETREVEVPLGTIERWRLDARQPGPRMLR